MQTPPPIKLNRGCFCFMLYYKQSKSSSCMPKTERAPSSPPPIPEAAKRSKPEAVKNAPAAEPSALEGIHQALQQASAIAEKYARGEAQNEDIRAVAKLMSKVHPDRFPGNNAADTAAKLISRLLTSMRGNESAWSSGEGNPTLNVDLQQAEQQLAQAIAEERKPISQKMEKQSEKDEAQAEQLREEISGIRKKVSPSVSYNPGPEMELGDEDIEYLDPKEETKRKTRVLQNKEANLRDKIAEAKKKITTSDRLKQMWQSLKGEPAIGPYYRLKALEIELEEVQRELGFLEEDQQMAKLRREAQEEFKTEKPSFIKSGKEVARDMARDAASAFMPGVESGYDREARNFRESQDVQIDEKDFTNPDEFEAALERDPKLAEQQRKDQQKANRDRLKQTAEARRKQAEEEAALEEQISIGRGASIRRAAPNVRSASPEEMAEKVRTRDMADRNMTDEEVSNLGTEFRARRRAAQQAEQGMSAAEIEAKVQADRAKYGWESSEEITDADILSIEDAKRKAPPTPMERARQTVRMNQENRYRELLGDRSSEVIGTIDNLFAQMSPAEASRLGFSRDEYLDYASGLLQTATDQWKDQKTGFTSEDYFKLAQRKLSEFNKKLGLPPDFVTGFGKSRLSEAAALGGNTAREESRRAANRVAGGVETNTNRTADRRSNRKSENEQAYQAPAEKAPAEYDIDLSDLEKGPLDEKFDGMVENASKTLGREQAHTLWNKINRALTEKGEAIKKADNYTYLTYRSGLDDAVKTIQALSPDVKTKTLETSLVFAITDLVKGTKNPTLLPNVMTILNKIGISKDDVANILNSNSSDTRQPKQLSQKRDSILETMGTYVMTPEEAAKYAVDDNGKPLKAEKRGTSRTVADRNQRSNARRYGGSTPTGM